MLNLTLASALLTFFVQAPAADDARLTRALDSIRSDELRADLHFFASQEMKGRDTPSNEQRVAARFLRARLERLGLTPGAGAGWFFEYPLNQRRIDPAGTRLTFLRPRKEGEAPDAERETLLACVLGEDYFLPTSSDIVTLERAGGLVYCGKGERADFDAVDARGKYAVCLTSDMPSRRRARYAEGDGALGVLLIPDPAGEADPAAAECKRTMDFAWNGMPAFRPDAAGEEPDVGQLFLSLAATRRLLETAGLPRALPALGTVFALDVHDQRDGTMTIALENVCALWPGSDPVLAKEVIIVSAHYDHVGLQGGQIHPGADDNGSGSMGLLALAQALTEYGPMRRSIFLMWVSGEEKGLWGSEAWTKKPTLPPGHRAVCDLNIDMIGRNAPDYLLITPTKKLKHYNGLTRMAESVAPLEGFPKLGSADEYWERSDHMNFAVHMKIPVAFLFSDVHDDYHKPTDTPDKIDYDKIRRVTRVVLRMLAGLQTDSLTF
jgi:hypothetical protein